MILNFQDQPIDELSTPEFSTTLKDEDGNIITGSAIDEIKLTYYNVADGSTINTRIDQDALANGVTVDAQGLLTWQMETGDAVIVLPAEVPINELEKHKALFFIKWNSGTRQDHFELEFYVKNLGKVA